MSIKWKKLEAPKPWRPTLPDEELVGYYLGQSVRKGSYGEYTVALIAVMSEDGSVGTPYMVSGAALINAIDGSLIQIGTLLKVVYGGVMELSEGRKMKMFEVFKQDGVLAAEDMPVLHGEA
jgi:hypothetical protein